MIVVLVHAVVILPRTLYKMLTVAHANVLITHSVFIIMHALNVTMQLHRRLMGDCANV